MARIQDSGLDHLQRQNAYSERDSRISLRSKRANALRALSNRHAEVGLRVYVTGDGPDVFEDVLFKIAKGDTQYFQPTLLLVGTRLGIDRVTPVYWEALKGALHLPQSVGIAG